MMYKNVHFISGLPRAGSTLLSSILNQNPVFSASISGPLARFVRAIINESFASPGYKLQCHEEKRVHLIKTLINEYISYGECETKTTFFDTNRGWTSLLNVINITNPRAKVICCVRDIKNILDSFEKLFVANPFAVSSMYSPEEAETVYTRSYALMNNGHTLRFAYESLKGAWFNNRELRSKLFLIEYNMLASSPEKTMRAIYKFIDEPYFDHDFDNVETSYDEFDNEANINGLHKIRKKVEYKERDLIIPPDIIQSVKGMEFWRHN